MEATEGIPATVGGARPWAAHLLDGTRQLLAVVDDRGVLLDCSAHFATLAGSSTADLLDRPLLDAPVWRTAERGRARLAAALDAAAAGAEVRYAVEQTPTDVVPTGPAALDISLTPVRHAGRVTHIVIDAVDVSGERAAHLSARADRAAAERSAQLQMVLDVSGMLLWSWDPSSDKVSWTPAGGRVAGVRVPDGPMAAALETLVDPRELPRLRDALGHVVSDGGALDVELPVNAPGAPRWILVRGHAQRSADGRASRVTGAVLDITDRAVARDEHARLLDAERRASRRATALQRIATALSEAVTSEQVAAVMAEESLRWLGAAASRIELRHDDPVGGPAPWAPYVVRTAGAGHLLDDLVAAPRRGSPATGLVVDAGPAQTRIGIDLLSRGRRRGRWTLSWRTPAAGGGPTDVDWSGTEGRDLLRSLATECAQALDRAELYEEQRDIATVLQRTLLPSVPPSIPGALVAARYQPAGQGVDVGGDWYDVIALPGGRTGLVIGDVEGHSATAAAVMGQARNALRAYAVEGATPAAVVERLNRLLVRLEITHLVTCCYLEFAPAEGTATVVLAGHPPPLVLRPDGHAGYVEARPNLVLGIDESALFVETTVLLDPGTHLLLYTDGLVESVDGGLTAGMAALCDWAAEVEPGASPEDLVESVVRRSREGDRPVLDDVAALAVSFRPPRRLPGGPLRAVRRTLPLDPASASAARRFVTDVLAQWGHAGHAAQVTLMTSELVTNSVLHTTGELQLGVFLDTDRLRVEVVDHSDRMPRMQDPDDDAPGGRGLLIIEALATTWGVEQRGGGKAVWFEVSL